MEGPAWTSTGPVRMDWPGCRGLCHAVTSSPHFPLKSFFYGFRTHSSETLWPVQGSRSSSSRRFVGDSDFLHQEGGTPVESPGLGCSAWCPHPRQAPLGLWGPYSGGHSSQAIRGPAWLSRFYPQAYGSVLHASPCPSATSWKVPTQNIRSQRAKVIFSRRG